MVALFVLGVLLIILASLLLMFWGISWLFGRISGWNRLAAQYGCKAPEGVWTFFRESARIGPVRYRRIVKAGLRPEGLFLSISSIVRHKTICIPWAEFGGFQSEKLYWRDCMRMSVGKPQISTLLLSTDLYRAMYPYLAKGAIS
jgi:hypothetical protein